MGNFRPTGSLGALGPLGPLGPIGAHGYFRDSSGHFRSNSGIEREVGVLFNSRLYFYELYEQYTESTAKNLNNNDTSFMVEGHISFPFFSNDTYEFTSNHQQWLSILLVPQYLTDDIDITLKNHQGHTIAVSNSSGYIDWIQLQVDAGSRWRVDVQLYASGHALNKAYRLFVTGGTERFYQTDITGPHQIPSL